MLLSCVQHSILLASATQNRLPYFESTNTRLRHYSLQGNGSVYAADYACILLGSHINKETAVTPSVKRTLEILENRRGWGDGITCT